MSYSQSKTLTSFDQVGQPFISAIVSADGFSTLMRIQPSERQFAANPTGPRFFSQFSTPDYGEFVTAFRPGSCDLAAECREMVKAARRRFRVPGWLRSGAAVGYR